MMRKGHMINKKHSYDRYFKRFSWCKMNWRNISPHLYPLTKSIFGGNQLNSNCNYQNRAKTSAVDYYQFSILIDELVSKIVD